LLLAFPDTHFRLPLAIIANAMVKGKKEKKCPGFRGLHPGLYSVSMETG
jgi:hypothetical protein